MAAVAKDAKEISRLAKILGPSVGGTVTPLAMDYRMNDDPDAVFGLTTLKDLFSGNMDKNRVFNLGLNSLIGATGGSMVAHGNVAGGAGVLTLAPAKDLIMNSLNASKDIKEAIQENAQATAEAAEAASAEDKKKLLILGALGAGALGLGGLGIYNYITRDPDKETAKIKMKLPGKKGDPDSAAEVELPINMPEFSPALTEGLDRAVRLRTRKNIRANSLKRDPETGKLIPYDVWKEKYGNTEEGEGAEPAVIPPAFADQLNKAAGSREIHEHLGDLTTSLLPALGGAVIGRNIAENHEVSPWIGGTAGALVAGAIPTLLGRGIAAMSDNRTPEEQAAHDEETPLLEYLLPGYAAYQSERRDSVRNAEMERMRAMLAGQSIGQESYNNGGQFLPPSFAGGVHMPTAITEEELDEGDDLTEEDVDDEYDKAASAPPPPPQGGGGPNAGGGQQQPVDPRMSRQVDPNQNNVSAGIHKGGDPLKAIEAVKRTDRTLFAAQGKPMPTQKRQVSLSEIHGTMQEMGDRLHNLSLLRYGNA